MLEGFERRRISAASMALYAKIGGTGPPLLLIHGFPETHLMWRDVAQALADQFTLICVDLPGQGESDVPAGDEADHPFSKRAMAAELVDAMRRLGFDRFFVAGHDRGGRVAYRMALDRPDVVKRLAVLDVVPILEAWERADARLALAFWPWSLLAQPAPLPERLIGACPEAVIEDAVMQWGTAAECFPVEIREAYARPLRDPQRVRAICGEFRSAATVDRDHDEADRQAGRKIMCPLLLLWDETGALGNWYAGEGGPVGIWNRWALDVRGKPMPGGHFFPEAHPEATAEELQRFFLEG